MFNKQSYSKEKKIKPIQINIFNTNSSPHQKKISLFPFMDYNINQKKPKSKKSCINQSEESLPIGHSINQTISKNQINILYPLFFQNIQLIL